MIVGGPSRYTNNCIIRGEAENVTSERSERVIYKGELIISMKSCELHFRRCGTIWRIYIYCIIRGEAENVTSERSERVIYEGELIISMKSCELHFRRDKFTRAKPGAPAS